MAYLFSDTIQCVSENLKLELRNKFHLKKKISVIPCLANNCVRRNDICQEKIKFVYVGGLSRWQNIDLIISVSLKIQEEIESIFTFITNNPEELETKIKKTGLKNYNIISGNNEFVQNNLVKQDFGFLFRDDFLFNRISSPIKFLEYTSNGVVPIITPYVGDFSTDVIRNEIGIIFNQDICKLITDIKKTILKMEIYRKSLYTYSLPLTWGNFDNSKQ
jgi:glycosyltransferase involved in cell wall biosynthesis